MLTHNLNIMKAKYPNKQYMKKKGEKERERATQSEKMSEGETEWSRQ